MDIAQIWQSLSQGQGTVVAAIITLIAAVVGVVLGSRLFGARVKDFQSALGKTEKDIESHIENILNKVRDFEEVMLVKTCAKVGHAFELILRRWLLAPK